jgi:ribonuclease P protein component
MLKRANRINKTRDLQRVYRLGKPVHSSALVIKFVAAPAGASAAQSQVAFVVSKKVSKKAVLRNRVKRVLREKVRLNLSRQKPGKYLVIVKPQAANMTAAELRAQISHALSKIR